MLAAAAVPILLILLYAVLATALPTSWQLNEQGLTLRSAAVLGIAIRIPWKDIASIGLGTHVVYHTTLEAMNLDARVMWQRHVTLVRRRGIRAVQFTPRDMARFERRLGSLLGERPEWALRGSGWLRVHG